jgi:hypothetical protein
MKISFLAYSSTLKMQAKYSSETLVGSQETTWRYIPEDKIIYNHSQVSNPFKFTAEIIV